MALQVGEALLAGLGSELSVQLVVAGAEGDVHEGAGVLVSCQLEQLGAFQALIQHVGLLDVQLLDGSHAAHGLHPVAHQTQHVDGPAGRSVVHGVLLDHVLVAHDRGGEGHLVAGQLFLDDGDGQTCGSQVLLSACVDQAVLAHVNGTGHDVGGHVADQGNTGGSLGDVLPLGALDGVVGAVVQVGSVGVQGQLVLGGDIGPLAVLGGTGHVGLAVLLGFLVGCVCEVAGADIVSLAGLGHQVHGNHSELHGSAALQEQDLVAFGHAHQLAELLLGLVEDALVDLGAVRHLHDGHAGALVVGDLSSSAVQDFQRKHGGTCGKVKNTIVCHRKKPLSDFVVAKILSSKIQYLLLYLSCPKSSRQWGANPLKILP